MIKTSSEGTSYCTQCESWARENEELKRLLAHERDEFEKRETELMKENAELTIQAERIFPVKDIADKLAHDNLRLSFRNEKLEAVARAAEGLLSGHDNIYLAHFGSRSNPLNDIAAKPMREALAALREGKP